MELRADHRLLVVCLLSAGLFLSACSREESRGAASDSAGELAQESAALGILPSPAYGYHQLHLASGASAASYGREQGVTQGQLVVWLVNGEVVHSGPSLDPVYTAPGDRVVAIIKAADASGTWQEISRHQTVVEDSPPRVLEVHLQRDGNDPFLIHAVLRADDPDGQDVQITYRWFVDGVLQEGRTAPQLKLAAEAAGSKVEVEAVADDGALRSKAMRSPAMTLEAPAIRLEIGSTPEVRELDTGGREYLVSLDFTPGAEIELLDAPSTVRYRHGKLVWRPAVDEHQLHMRVRVKGSDGSSAEREISLQI